MIWYNLKLQPLLILIVHANFYNKVKINNTVRPKDTNYLPVEATKLLLPKRQ